MEATTNNHVIEWKVSMPSSKSKSKRLIINWMVVKKIFIPVLLYSWIYFNDFTWSIPIGKNFLTVLATSSEEVIEDWSITWPHEQYWEIDDELARSFIQNNTSIVQSLEIENQIPAGVQMAIGLFNIQNFNSYSSEKPKTSSWTNQRRISQKWKNQGRAISHLFLEKGQIPNSREDWYQKVVEHFNLKSEGAGFLVQNLIAFYDLKKLDQQKS